MLLGNAMTNHPGSDLLWNLLDNYLNTFDNDELELTDCANVLAHFDKQETLGKLMRHFWPMASVESELVRFQRALSALSASPLGDGQQYDKLALVFPTILGPQGLSQATFRLYASAAFDVLNIACRKMLDCNSLITVPKLLPSKPYLDDLVRWRVIARSAADYLLRNESDLAQGITSLDPEFSDLLSWGGLEGFLVDFLYEIFHCGYICAYFSGCSLAGWHAYMDYMIQSWVLEVLGLGLDLEVYGRKANALYKSTNIKICLRQNGGKSDPSWIPLRMISLTYGPRPQDWHFSWSNPLDEWADDFWQVVARGEEDSGSTSQDSPMHVPGSWCEDDLESGLTWSWRAEEQVEVLEVKMERQVWRKQRPLGRDWGTQTGLLLQSYFAPRTEQC